MQRWIIGGIAGLLWILWLQQLADAADWPTYRADAARSGYTADPLPKNLTLQWVYRAKHAPKPAWPSSARMHFDLVYQPIVIGDTVVFGSSASDQIVALDAETGQRRWTFLTAGPVRFAPAGWRDRVFVAGDDGWLYAIALADGTLLWKHRGGPNDRMCLGNGRMISRWPARGGPVVFDDVVYFAAGIWPSDGVYLHALDAETGNVIWTNDETGTLYMPQPHGGANAHSGVAPQGYLLATDQRLFVPTGRAVTAAFRRSDGSLEYYHLQQNGSIGGSRAMLADRFLCNAGCFFERNTGLLAARSGRGLLTATPDGILQSTGATLVAYQWKELEKPDRKGNPVRYRGLEKFCEVKLDKELEDPARLTKTLQQLPALKNLYEMNVRFKEVYESVPKETGLERTLSQARPDVESFGLDAGRFLATTYEKTNEVIAAADEAVCGVPGSVSVVDLQAQQVRWSHAVEGAALGIAAANGRLIASTTQGVVYCFGDGTEQTAKKPNPPASSTIQSSSASDNVDYAAAAEEILKKSGVTGGFCVDLAGGRGELALELAKRSKLHVCVVESDATKVAEARRMLDAAGIYGTRVIVHHADPANPPYPKYFANLIVSAGSLSDTAPVLPEETLRRMQRPFGGVICVGKLGRMEARLRGPLDGAGSWTHQNSNAANTLCSADRLVKGPLEMFWFRDGVLEIPDRHAQGPAPLVNRGYLVVEGVDGVCALDAYNGRTLWTFPIEGILADQDGVHHDVGVGDTGGNFCLSDDSVYVRTDDRCLRIDLATGQKLNQFKTPVAATDKNRAWGYVAYSDGLLFGSVANDEHTVSPRYGNIRLRTESVLFFSMDAQTGKVKWRYKPKESIRNNAIAIADGRVYLVDRPLAMEDRITDPQPNGKHRSPLKPGEHPGGVLIALDAASGKVLWRQDDDVFGTQLAVSEKNDVVLMYYQAVKHSFFKLPSEIGGRMAAFDAATGARLWDIEATHVTRPIINGDVIYAEGGAWEVKIGKPMAWEFERSYGCGQISAGTHLLLFRSATLGYLDLTRNAGAENFGGVRPGCWFNAVPAGGLVLVPDGSSKCACSYQMQAWLALQQRE